MGKQRTMRSGNFCVTVVRQSLTEKNEKNVSISAGLFSVQEKRQKETSNNWMGVREGITEYLIFKTL